MHLDKFRFIGELSVMDSSPCRYFDEDFRKMNISNHNLKRELFWV